MSDEGDRPEKGRRAEVRAAGDSLAPGELPEDGLAFGRYRLLRRLSYGGMGEIFLAKHDGIGGFSKLLVIKRLLMHYRGDKDVVAMFFDEAKLQALMSDRHIVQIWDMGKVDDQYFIAMEYVEGTSWRRLGERLFERGEALHPAHAVDLVVQACRGLGYAHNLSGPDGGALSLVHRDVNPQNVLVSYAGEVKLIDFGIAKSELSGHHTETGTIKGKFAYMSPEQARAEPLDRRSDIFSMGICLYELLTGKNPFHRKNVVLSLEAICEQAPPPLEKARPEAAALAPVVERCIAKNPDERFADCVELEEALVSLYLDGLCGEPAEPLSDLLQRTFHDEIEEQSAFLQRHGFAPLAAKRTGSSDPGTPSPFGRSGDITRRTLVRRSQTQSQSQGESRSQSQSQSKSKSRKSRVPVDSGSAANAADTHPTATLALASLPSRSGERTPSPARASSTEEVRSRTGEERETFVEDTEVPELLATAAPAARPAARVAVLVGVALLLALAGGFALVASSDAATLDALLAAVSSPSTEPAGQVTTVTVEREPTTPPEPATVTDAGNAAPSSARDASVVEEAAGTGAAEEPVFEAAVVAEERAADAGAAAVEEPEVEVAAGEGGEAIAEEAITGEDERRTRVTRRDRPRASKRRPSREKRADARADEGSVEKAEKAEKAEKVEEKAPPEPMGVLTVNAGGPFTIQGKGVRARNVAKVSLVAGEPRGLTISGGPVKVRLRVSAGEGGAEVRVDSEPWTIVRANNIGRGRTPQTVRVGRGDAVQLLLKHPEAGELKVTLGLSR